MATRKKSPPAPPTAAASGEAVVPPPPPWTGFVLVAGERDAVVPAGHALLHADGRRYVTVVEAKVGAFEDEEDEEAKVAVQYSGEGEGALQAGEVLTLDPLLEGVDAEAIVLEAATPETTDDDTDAEDEEPPLPDDASSDGAGAGEPDADGQPCTLDVMLQGPQRVMVAGRLSEIREGRGTVVARLPDGRTCTLRGVVIVPASRRGDIDAALELPRAIVG